MVSADHELLDFPEAKRLRALAWQRARASEHSKHMPSCAKNTVPSDGHSFNRYTTVHGHENWLRSLHSQKCVCRRFCRPFHKAQVSEIFPKGTA